MATMDMATAMHIRDTRTDTRSRRITAITQVTATIATTATTATTRIAPTTVARTNWHSGAVPSGYSVGSGSVLANSIEAETSGTTGMTTTTAIDRTDAHSRR